MTHSGNFLVNCSAEDVFELTANPERFVPLLPDFESMVLQDATHFTLRIVIAMGQINGHANLAMELREALRPSRVDYRGEGIVAGSQLSFGMQFQIAPGAEAAEVSWQGEVTLDGMLAFMAGDLLDTMGRRNFELMAERLQNSLRAESTAAKTETPAEEAMPDSDFEI